MRLTRIIGAIPIFLAGLSWISCATDDRSTSPAPKESGAAKSARSPTWSREDLQFFLHGSMSTEFVPELVLLAFIRADPDLFPSRGLREFGLIPDAAFGWPVGLSRTPVAHLGGLSALGINCAACHVAEVTSSPDRAPVLVLGATAHFDAEAFFSAVMVAMFRTGEPAGMKKFLAAYLALSDPDGGDKAQLLFSSEWQRQEPKIQAAITADPSGAKELAPGALHALAGTELRLSRQRLEGGLDLAAFSHSMLKLFHNMRAAFHVPDEPPKQALPASGPGRNDAFGLLSAALLGVRPPYAPVKYGLVWNLEHRHWVHWDGNTRSPIGRNLLASLGLGAPLLGRQGQLDFALIQRQTQLSEHIPAPRYPFAINRALADRGATHYRARCAACHDGPETDGRLHAVAEVGTDPRRAEAFTQDQADRFNLFLAWMETPGYQPAQERGLRGTQRYWAPSLPGVWARSPFLHNGSVRTMQELLTSPAARAKTFRRGSRIYDAAQMGYTDEGAYVFETSNPGNANTGHDYGTDLTAAQKRELIEFLKTL
jgi:hypothetical protein